jgi:ABC-type multidrug transport system ATPase subunit
VEIILDHIGKKFGRNWLFQSISATIHSNHLAAITGRNGSGKSTLLQLIMGYQVPSQGKVIINPHKPIESSELHKSISFVAPYLELPEELTLEEFLQFHFQFKKAAISFSEMLSLASLSDAKHKQLRHFSSGMKQRVKLIAAFYAQTPILLLDEPTSNLDEAGINWYQTTLATQLGTRTIIVASNAQHEYVGHNSIIEIG